MGVWFDGGAEIFLFSTVSGLAVEFHPASCVMGTGAVCLGVKQPGCEVDHSPPCSAEVRDVYLHFPTHLNILIYN
jgi:hypothetical protein